MKKIIVALLVVFSSSLIAQTGAIAGKIWDIKTKEALIGAVVKVKGTTIGTSTDIEGNYTLSNLLPGNYSLVCISMGYDSIIKSGIVVVDNQTSALNFEMSESEAVKVDQVTKVARKVTNTMNAELIERKERANMGDAISAEAMKKTADRNVSDAMKRVSGASIQDNKFAVVRGLNDRYNAAYLNGSPLPSTESDRKAFSFDIFPSSLLDNLTIIKTATPDMPAEFAGGIININTKGIPDANSQSISISGGYNPFTTNKQFYTYAGGKYDWLGFDDGSRKLNSNIPSVADYKKLTISQQGEMAKYMAGDWSLQEKLAKPNVGMQYNLNHIFKLAKRELGASFALTYNSTNLFTETKRIDYQNSSSDLTTPILENYLVDKNYSQQILMGILGNFGYRINPNNEIQFKNLYSINSDDRVVVREGKRDVLSDPLILEKSNLRWFTSNKIYTSQIIGKHTLKSKKLMKLDWNVAYSNVIREVPNMRRNVTTTISSVSDESLNGMPYSAAIAFAGTGPSAGGNFFYSKNNESIYSSKADWSLALNKEEAKFKTIIKSGAFAQIRTRNFTSRSLGFTKYGIQGGSIQFNENLLTQDENTIYSAENMGLISSNVGGFKLEDGTKLNDEYKAGSNLFAAYVLGDSKWKEKLRFIYGARVEYFNQVLTALYDDGKPVDLNTVKVDVLPSFNAIYSITEKQNLRFCYSQTLNRPEYRELAPFAFYDFTTNFVITGYDKLKRALIHNYDLRYELYPGRGQVLSATAFYKNFINPIEQITRADVAREISFNNVDKATNYGAEIEFRVLLGSLLRTDSCKFLNNLTIFSNYTYIRSVVDMTNVIGYPTKTRSLQGQSPYIINAGIQYQDNERNFSVSTSLNRVGDRISIVGSVLEPDIRENGRTFIDFQVAKSFLKNRLEIKYNLRDALAQNQNFYQDANANQKFDKNIDAVIWQTRFAQTHSFAISFKF